MNLNADVRRRFEEKIMPVTESGCWIWLGCLGSTGYGNVTVQQESVHAHRLSYLLYCGELSSGDYVCHRCDVRSCVNPTHLFKGTALINIQDMVKKGRNYRGPRPCSSGELNSNAKLNEEKVVAIRRDYCKGSRGYGALAAKYGVSRSVIYSVVKGKSWKLLI